MDSNALKTFIAVADSGSFSQAAEQLYLTQPAISKRIASLEETLNAPLFDRIGRHVHLTEAGRLFYPRALRILSEIENSATEINNLTDKIAGKLELATSHHIGLHRLPDVLRIFTQKFPGVELNLGFMNSETICDNVVSGSVELGIVTLPLQPVERLSTQCIWQDPLEFVVGHIHPLVSNSQQNITTQQQGRINTSLQELTQFPAILPGTGTFTRQIIENTFQLENLSVNTKLATNYLENIKMLVGVGLGWSVLPRTLIDKDLRLLNVNNIKLNRNLGAVWHSQRTISNAARKMLELLSTEASTKRK